MAVTQDFDFKSKLFCHKKLDASENLEYRHMDHCYDAF